ncbi:MAG: hypothetical protein ACR2IT_09965 [Pirellulales bacterium]
MNQPIDRLVVIIGDPGNEAYCAGSVARMASPAVRNGKGPSVAVDPFKAAGHGRRFTTGMTMKILARIPALVPLPTSCAAPACAEVVPGVRELVRQAVAQSPPPSEPTEPAPAAAPQPAASPPASRQRQRRSGPRFPLGSVAALAVIAALAWSLASWNDGRRAEHSRLERLARMQSPPTTAGTVAR